MYRVVDGSGGGGDVGVDRGGELGGPGSVVAELEGDVGACGALKHQARSLDGGKAEVVAEEHDVAGLGDGAGRGSGEGAGVAEALVGSLVRGLGAEGFGCGRDADLLDAGG